MNKKLEIVKEVGGRYFKQEGGYCIQCAFNLEQPCTPDCAACDVGGTNIVRCIRLGEEIGYITSS